MRAVVLRRFGGPEVLELADLPDPRPGPGQVRVTVRAAGVEPTDAKARAGLLGGALPMTLGREVAGVVDLIGEGVAGVSIGDAVFGFVDGEEGAGAAELALLTHLAPLPDVLGFAEAASLPVVLETATRALDALGVTAGTVLLISGASGGIGCAAVQLAAARGARVIGSGAARNQDRLRALGAEPVVYGDDLLRQVRALAPEGVDRALDVSGAGVLPQLIELAGGPQHVVTLADVPGARRTGVRFSTGEDGRASRAIDGIGALIESGRFARPVVRTFPLEHAAAAHRALEDRTDPARPVLVVGQVDEEVTAGRTRSPRGRAA